jgi:hypothetical protein
MRPWQHPAQPLPVRVRPVSGETLISYTFRLAAANDLQRPTMLLHALGQPTTSVHQTMLANYDIVLNHRALDRLEIITGLPALRLRRCLPTLQATTPTLRTDIPATRPYRRAVRLRRGCDKCAARLPGHPTIITHSLTFPLLCLRHQRWIATTSDQPHQIDVTATPEIRTAHRRYARLRVNTDDDNWTHQQLRQATSIAMTWAARSHLDSPKLHASWNARAAALDTSPGPHEPSPLLVFPEAVALTEILCDLHWRRHVAMVNDWQLVSFYRRIGLRLDQPNAFASTIYLRTYDPLRAWVDIHRHRHTYTRTEFWQRHRHRSWAAQTPFPTIRHFK